MTSPLGIGIIGTGFGGSVILPAFRSLPGCRIVGIASKNGPNIADIRVFSGWEEMAASQEIDAIVVAAPQFTHREIVAGAIAAGKHVLCEKPLGCSVSDARMLLDAATEGGIVHMVDFEFRELQALQWLRGEIRNGALGHLRELRFRWSLGSWADPERPWFWHCDASLGGGVVQSHGSHAFDLLEWLTEPVAEMCASTGIAIPVRNDEKGKPKRVTAEDHADILLKWTNGASGGIHLTTVAPCGTGMWIEAHGEKKSCIVGTPETFRYGKNVRAWEGTRKNETLLEHPLPPDDDGEEDVRIALVRKLGKRFLSAIRSGKMDDPSFATGLRVQELCEAAKRSTIKGNWVTTDPYSV